MLIIAILAFSKGNPSTLATPYDPDHRGCGVDEGVVDYPYIYFTSPDPDYLWRTVCVKECPTTNDTELKCAVNKYVTDCNGVKYTGKKADKKEATPPKTKAYKTKMTKYNKAFNHKLGVINFSEKTYIY